MESDYIRMGDSRRPTPSHRLNAYCTVIVRVSDGYGYTRGSGRVWVEIFGAGRVRVRVASSATGTGWVAEIFDPHTLVCILQYLCQNAEVCQLSTQIKT